MFQHRGPPVSACAASMVTLNLLTRHVAAELEGTGVATNALQSGDVRTTTYAYIRRGAEESYEKWVAGMVG